MAKDNSRFFDRKMPWSEVKDDLLECYLKAYFQKVLATHRPVRYLDCFAGRGEFKDGKPGSPLIALNVAYDCLAQGRTGNRDLRLEFIEAVHQAELAGIVAAAERGRDPLGTVLGGRFERDVLPMVQSLARCNVFLYIDPYGIRDLDLRLIESLASGQLGLNSIEVLINLNSFGFLRAGCLAMRVRYQDDAALRDDEDEEFTESLSSLGNGRSVDLLDTIAGGDYWRAIIEDFRQGRMSGYDAERSFADLYRRRLGETYRYVLSMPIRLADRQQPKYRMVHATNHPDGCVLMADNMMTRTQNLYMHLTSYSQGTILPVDVEGEITDATMVEQQLETLLAPRSDFVDSQELMADFYVEYGVICKPQVIREAWAKMEKADVIAVKRDPPITAQGKPSRFYTNTKGHKLAIKLTRPLDRSLF